MKYIITFFLWLLILPFFSQEQQYYKVVKIDVVGNETTSDDAIIIISGLKLGGYITMPSSKIQLAVKKLWNERVFYDIKISKEIESKEFNYVKFMIRHFLPFIGNYMEKKDKYILTESEIAEAILQASNYLFHKKFLQVFPEFIFSFRNFRLNADDWLEELERLDFQIQFMSKNLKILSVDEREGEKFFYFTEDHHRNFFSAVHICNDIKISLQQNELICIYHIRCIILLKINFLIDKSVFPRDKICGDALSGKVIDVLEECCPSFLDHFRHRKDIFAPSPGIRFYGPNDKHIDIPCPNRKDDLVAGYVAKREGFDNLLIQHLDPNYVTFIQGIEDLTFIEGQKVSFECEDGQYNIQYDLLIAGDGARSKVSEHFLGRIQDDKHHSAAIRAYYRGVTGFESDYIELHFIDELLPGYFWVFPLPNGEANVGLGMLSAEIKKHKVNLRKILDDLVANHPRLKDRFKNAEQIDRTKGWGLPLGSKKRQICAEHLMLAGDAAWLIDPFTGEGIGNAVHSGQIAAKWAVKALTEKNFSHQFFRGYQEEIFRRLGPELALSHKLQKLSSVKWLFNFLINKAVNNKQLRETMTSMFSNVDLRAQLKNPMFYLRLLKRN